MVDSIKKADVGKFGFVDDVHVERKPVGDSNWQLFLFRLRRPRCFAASVEAPYPVDDLARFGNQYVCVNCKPGYVQRMREGAQPVGAFMPGVQYGGFWIRGLALLNDGLIVSVVTVPLFLLIGFSSGGFRNFEPANPPLALFGAGIPDHAIGDICL